MIPQKLGIHESSQGIIPQEVISKSHVTINLLTTKRYRVKMHIQFISVKVFQFEIFAMPSNTDMRCVSKIF